MRILPILLTVGAGLAWAQSIEQAHDQLREARRVNTEQAYLEAESILNRLSKQDANNIEILFARGMVRLERAGWYAQNSKFGLANEVMAQACADLDRAVTLRPQDATLRLKRGTIYARFPEFLGKGTPAREDLEIVLGQPDFESKPERVRAQVRLLLGQLHARSGETVEARQQFEIAAALAPGSEEGKAAAAELAKLAAPLMATDARGRRMPDRFPQLSSDISPVIVAATVTFPKQAGDLASLKQRVAWIVDSLKGQPGLLGTHVLTSLDYPGMVTILTWWKDKIAVNNFFYGEVHQGMIRRSYGDRTADVEATQVGVELFSTLTAGKRFGGGVTPEAVWKGGK